MTLEDKYTDRNAVLKPSTIKYCYLCGYLLDGVIKPDHIIPNSIFKKGSPNRPKLPTHDQCNNKKSKDDEWFLRQIGLICGMNPEASEGLEKLLLKAEQQKNDAFIIGKSNKVRDYKLAVSLLDKKMWGLQLRQDGQTKYMLHIGEENNKRTNNYIKRLCRGLYLLNVPSSNPTTKPRLYGIQYAKAMSDGSYDKYMSPIINLINNTSLTGFYQDWPSRVFYYGSQVIETTNKGFIFIEFYREAGYLVMFGNGD